MGMVMTQEDKDLLLRDLCARIPYNVKGCLVDECGTIPNDPYLRNISLTYISLVAVDGRDGRVLRGEIKPYLLPLSSMTEVQVEELYRCSGVMLRRSGCISLELHVFEFTALVNALKYLDQNHFDYRGLIPKGLAIDATGLGIY